MLCSRQFIPTYFRRLSLGVSKLFSLYSDPKVESEFGGTTDEFFS